LKIESVNLPVLAELIGRGDGTFILRPKVPDQDLDTWVTLSQAARIIGNVGPRNLYPFLGQYLVYRRPLPRRVVVSLRSAMALKQATQDPEFWENPTLQQRVRDSVKATMDKLARAASETLAGA